MHCCGTSATVVAAASHASELPHARLDSRTACSVSRASLLSRALGTIPCEIIKRFHRLSNRDRGESHRATSTPGRLISRRGQIATANRSAPHLSLSPATSLIPASVFQSDSRDTLRPDWKYQHRGALLYLSLRSRSDIRPFEITIYICIYKCT